MTKLHRKPRGSFKFNNKMEFEKASGLDWKYDSSLRLNNVNFKKFHLNAKSMKWDKFN